jgi:O-antigen/teichoic acid export membrane protein
VSAPEQPGRLTPIVVRGSGLTGLGWAGGQIMNLAIYVVLARLATPAEFGQLAAGSILVLTGGLFAGSGMTAALIHRRDRVEEAANTALVATILAGVGLSLVVLAASPLVGLFFGSHVVTTVAAATAGWVLLRAATSVPDALMQRRFSILRRVIVEPVGIVVFGVVSIVTLTLGMGVWGLVLGNTAQLLTMAVAAFALARWRPRLRLASFPLWREMVRYGRHVITGQFVGLTGGQLQRAVVGGFVGTASLGQYTYATRLGLRPYDLMSGTSSYLLFPAFARIADDPERLRRAFVRSLRAVALIGMPLGLVLIPLGEPAAVVLLGEPWRAAGYVMMAMAGYTGCRSLFSLCSEALKGAGRPEILPKINLLSAISGPIFMLALLPLGLTGVAVGVSASAAVAAAYALRRATRVLELPGSRVLHEIWPPAAAAVAMAIIMYPVEHFVVSADSRSAIVGVTLLVLEGLVAMGVYVAALGLIAPRMTTELFGLLRAIRARVAGGRGSPESSPETEVPPAPTPAK